MVVRYFAEIRRLAAQDTIEVREEASSVRALLGLLSIRNGAAFEKRVFPEGRVSSTIILLVNGRNIEHLDGLDTRLSPDDEVSIFPMVAGG